MWGPDSSVIRRTDLPCQVRSLIRCNEPTDFDIALMLGKSHVRGHNCTILGLKREDTIPGLHWQAKRMPGLQNVSYQSKHTMPSLAKTAHELERVNLHTAM